MARLGLVEAGEQAAHDPRGAARAEDEVGPAVVGTTRPAGAALSSARTTVVPTATTRRPASSAPLTSARGGGGHGEPLGLRRLVRLLARDAGVEHERRDGDAARHQPHEQRRSVIDRPALAISALPGCSAYTFCSAAIGHGWST